MAEFTIRLAALLVGTAGVLMAASEILTVKFCDLARNPTAFFDKTVRLDAIFEQHTEGQYLTHESCPLSHDDQIGVGYPEEPTEALQRTRQQLRAPEYQDRAEVTLVGVLRNISARHFYWYAALFEVAAIEQARPAAAAYDGNLEEGRTYRAKASRNPSGELLIEPRSPVVPRHHAGRIEWADTNNVVGSPPFPKNWTAKVVFRVTSKQVVAAGPGSWRTTFHCDLLRLE